METHERLERWVNGRIAASEPADAWPDVAAGWQQMERRLARQAVPVFVWAGAAVTACAVVLALPAPRAVAQRLFDQVVVGRVQVLMMDDGVAGAAARFFTPEIYERSEARAVASLDDASRIAGFTPRLPAPDVFSASPEYSVTGITAGRVRLRTPALRYLVHEAGGAAGEVPEDWNGAVLEVRVGPVVIADYDGILLLQSQPFELITPAGFNLERFYRLAFRAFGIGEHEASALSTNLSISPALLMVMPEEERELVREFSTRFGTGVMIDGVYGPGRTLSIWSGSDRVYALLPTAGEVSPELVQAVAKAVD